MTKEMAEVYNLAVLSAKAVRDGEMTREAAVPYLERYADAVVAAYAKRGRKTKRPSVAYLLRALA